jgi:hypothetical protein
MDTFFTYFTEAVSALSTELKVSFVVGCVMLMAPELAQLIAFGVCVFIFYTVAKSVWSRYNN